MAAVRPAAIFLPGACHQSESQMNASS